MQSKNKPAMTVAEREHVSKIREMPCSCCDAPGPSEAHEIEQGSWFLSVPLCPECHRGGNGLHGKKTFMRIKKLSELDLLNISLGRLLYGRA
jgi:hypothetical protein